MSESIEIENQLTQDQCSLTPPGYGFDASASRIMSEGGGTGYINAYVDELIPDVVEKMYSSSPTTSDLTAAISGVALVYTRGGDFHGVFTERDYVLWSSSRDTSETLPERLNYSKSKESEIGKYSTPAEKVVTARVEENASKLLRKMKDSNIRHLLLTKSDGVPENKEDVVGVISMRRIMNVVVSDERLSLQALAKKFPTLVASYDPVEALKAERTSYANELAKREGVGKQDVIKFGTALTILGGVGIFLTESSWLHDHADLGMILIFILGYVGIIFEELFEFNKAAVALLMSTALWITYADFYNSGGKAVDGVLGELKEQLSEVSDICFFLLAASTIVEVVDAHQGFKVVTNAIKTDSKKQLFWIIGFLTFFLSSILNNLTVTIVMVSLLRKIIPDDDDRRLFGAMVVVAANAGGVWTPIGDVTTTMLWINHQLSTIPTVTELFLPSVVCLVGSLFFLQNKIVEDEPGAAKKAVPEASSLAPRGKLVFGAGIACLLAVPVFSELTGLPPYLAMLTGLGAMWTLTDAIHMGDEKEAEGLKVPAALAKLDTSGILFFLGILMSIGVLDKSGLLKELAMFLNDNLPGQEIIATVIGIASALIDNVPLVAATMGMYDLAEYGTDDRLWQLIALCAGTGGSILVIGSASGVALMGLEKVDFLWYLKNVSFGAAVGYFAGIATYLAESALLKGGGLGGITNLVAEAQAQIPQFAQIDWHGMGVQAANAIDVVATAVQ
ncbi:hypothetical protein TrVE_jg4756 [Triparma verrucosa]|uniref:CBS domain-containing protein n=1 Tax=Triparma verrucosa TaxID=1606542 RepID=A0A9W7F593_9STRA|nr:hypothetical protein TrVE_jg4756 [Triparma verrucosa]